MCCVKAYTQDVIVCNDGTTILSKVIEVSSSSIKYKKYSHLNGPLYTIDVSKIVSINYESGERDCFNTISEKQKEETPVDHILKAGTEIPIQIVSPVKAADVTVGQAISFKVNRDISVDGITVIPYGTPVKGIVYKADKSSWWGTKGKLGIQINNIVLPNGAKIPLNDGNVYVTGTNRTTLSVVLFLFVTIPACAICGSKAQIPVGYEIVTNIAEDISFDNNGNCTKADLLSLDKKVSISKESEHNGKYVSYKIDDKTDEGKMKLNGLTLFQAKQLAKKEVLEKYSCSGITDVYYDYNKMGNRIKYITIEGKLICE